MPKDTKPKRTINPWGRAFEAKPTSKSSKVKKYRVGSKQDLKWKAGS